MVKDNENNSYRKLRPVFDTLWQSPVIRAIAIEATKKVLFGP